MQHHVFIFILFLYKGYTQYVHIMIIVTVRNRKRPKQCSATVCQSFSNYIRSKTNVLQKCFAFHCS